MQFTAVKEFHSPELNSDYCAGLSYTVRTDDHILAALVPTWLAQGKIALGGGTSEIQGQG